MKCPNCAAENPEGAEFCRGCGQPLTIQPSSFADGRCQVKKFLGEGGKKKVYLAHDTLLHKDVAFALIKTKTPELASVRS